MLSGRRRQWIVAVVAFAIGLGLQGAFGAYPREATLLDLFVKDQGRAPAPPVPKD